jgi:hypothetical protein
MDSNKDVAIRDVDITPEDRRIVTTLSLQAPGATAQEIADRHFATTQRRLTAPQVSALIASTNKIVARTVPDNVREFFLYELARADVLENVAWEEFSRSRLRHTVVDKIKAVAKPGSRLDPESFDENIQSIERTINRGDGPGDIRILGLIRSIQNDRRKFMSSLLMVNQAPATIIDQKAYGDPGLLEVWDAEIVNNEEDDEDKS